MFGLGLTRFLPARLRSPLIASVTRLHLWQADRRARRMRRGERRRRAAERRFDRWMRHRKAEPRRYRGDAIAVVGFFTSRIGLGRAAELLALELEAGGARVYRLDATEALGLAANIPGPNCLDLGRLPKLRVSDVVVHMNPPQFMQALRLLGPGPLRRRSLVGYFAWELDRCPPAWAASVELVDAIWVPSRFVQDAIVTTCPGARSKLSVKPHRVDLSRVPPVTADQRRVARERLGLDPDHFVVLTSFSMASTMARKNPLAAMAAFQQGLDAGAPATLLVRCLDAEPFPNQVEILRRAAVGDSRIRLYIEGVHGTTIEPFYAAADTYLSLHRGEGFGLNLAEALMRGISVVATGWSLDDPLLSHPLMHAVPSSSTAVIDEQGLYDAMPDARWAEPDIAQAAMLLRRLSTASRAISPPGFSLPALNPSVGVGLS